MHLMTSLGKRAEIETLSEIVPPNYTTSGSTRGEDSESSWCSFPVNIHSATSDRENASICLRPEPSKGCRAVWIRPGILKMRKKRYRGHVRARIGMTVRKTKTHPPRLYSRDRRLENQIVRAGRDFRSPRWMCAKPTFWNWVNISSSHRSRSYATTKARKWLGRICTCIYVR